MMSGLINVLKPPGMTSHDVVSFLRRTYQLKRIGHAGTLDPAAAGVLPVALGTATRVIEYMTDCDKSYRVQLTIGYETDTGDDTGTVKKRLACVMPPEQQIKEVLASFVGRIEQVPPMYSAIKVDGKKLYELARAGITIERKARQVTINGIQLLKMDDTTLLFDVACSKGTYIRSLCTDIGEKINCPVVMSFLVRTSVGCFGLEQTVTLEEIQENPSAALWPIDKALGHMPAVVLNTEKTQAFQHGQMVTIKEIVPTDQTLLRIYNLQQTLIGIGQFRLQTNTIVPIKVLIR